VPRRARATDAVVAAFRRADPIGEGPERRGSAADALSASARARAHASAPSAAWLTWRPGALPPNAGTGTPSPTASDAESSSLPASPTYATGPRLHAGRANWRYAPHTIRGLVADKYTGHILKLDAQRLPLQIALGTAMLGPRQLQQVLEQVYGNKPLDVEQPSSRDSGRYLLVNSPFDMARVQLFQRLCDLRSRNVGALAKLSFEAIYDLANVAVDYANGDAQRLKLEVLKDPSRYRQAGPETDRALEQATLLLQAWGQAGRTRALITNSSWPFVRAAMRAFYGDQWRKLFELIVVEAKKPDFFGGEHPLERLIAEGSDRFEPVAADDALERAATYRHGNVAALQRMLGIQPARASTSATISARMGPRPGGRACTPGSSCPNSARTANGRGSSRGCSTRAPALSATSRTLLRLGFEKSVARSFAHGDPGVSRRTVFLGSRACWRSTPSTTPTSSCPTPALWAASSPPSTCKQPISISASRGPDRRLAREQRAPRCDGHPSGDTVSLVGGRATDPRLADQSNRVRQGPRLRLHWR
jgi:hypothetical protein